MSLGKGLCRYGFNEEVINILLLRIFGTDTIVSSRFYVLIYTLWYGIKP